jgi:hypothetical protein
LFEVDVIFLIFVETVVSAAEIELKCKYQFSIRNLNTAISHCDQSLLQIEISLSDEEDNKIEILLFFPIKFSEKIY